jgi:hypothetical protein
MADTIADLIAEMPQMEAKAAHWQERFTAYMKWLEDRYERQRKAEGRGVGSLESFQNVYGGIANKARIETEPELKREIYAYVDRLCKAYLTADQATCRQARQAIASANDVSSFLTGYVQIRTERIHDGQAEESLRLALAALSLYDMTFMPGLTPRWEEDYPNLKTWLNPLLDAAKVAGLDVVPHLKAIAALSSNQPSRVSPKSISFRQRLTEIAEDIGRSPAPKPPSVECPEVMRTGIRALPLTSDQPANGQVDTLNIFTAYQFQARKDQSITVRMQRTSGNINPLLSIEDVNGRALARETGPREATINGFTIPADGCYYVQVSCQNIAMGKTRGTYHLVVSGFEW